MAQQYTIMELLYNVWSYWGMFLSWLDPQITLNDAFGVTVLIIALTILMFLVLNTVLQRFNRTLEEDILRNIAILLGFVSALLAVYQGWALIMLALVPLWGAVLILFMVVLIFLFIYRTWGFAKGQVAAGRKEMKDAREVIQDAREEEKKLREKKLESQLSSAKKYLNFIKRAGKWAEGKIKSYSEEKKLIEQAKNIIGAMKDAVSSGSSESRLTSLYRQLSTAINSLIELEDWQSGTGEEMEESVHKFKRYMREARNLETAVEETDEYAETIKEKAAKMKAGEAFKKLDSTTIEGLTKLYNELDKNHNSIKDKIGEIKDLNRGDRRVKKNTYTDQGSVKEKDRKIRLRSMKRTLNKLDKLTDVEPFDTDLLKKALGDVYENLDDLDVLSGKLAKLESVIEKLSVHLSNNIDKYKALSKDFKYFFFRIMTIQDKYTDLIDRKEVYLNSAHKFMRVTEKALSKAEEKSQSVDKQKKGQNNKVKKLKENVLDKVAKSDMPKKGREKLKKIIEVAEKSPRESKRLLKAAKSYPSLKSSIKKYVAALPPAKKYPALPPGQKNVEWEGEN